MGFSAMIKEILSSDVGNLSTMRVSTIIIVLTILGTWVWKNTQASGMVDFPDNCVWLLASTLAAAAGQKLAERMKPGTPQ